MIWLSDKNAINIKPLKKSYIIASKEISFETGKFGLLANWSVSVSDNNGNILFVTAWVKETWVNEKADFFPLVVDFQEKYYANWKIGWNRFMKRESRPSDWATLTSRLIDRPIRPMFPKWIINDTQIIANVLSSDWVSDMWAWWITWASIALMMTWMPFEWPVSWVKIAMLDDGSFIYEPTFIEEESAKLNLVVAWTLDAITMVEAWAKQVSDEEMLKGLEYAHNLIKELCNAQNDFIIEYKNIFGIYEPKIFYNNPDLGLYWEVKKYLTEEKLESLYGKWKKEFQSVLDTLDLEVREFLLSQNLVEENSDLGFVWELVYKRVKEVMRKNILQTEKRLDLRALNEVRNIKGETWLLPRTHGSALFQRWMTQALSITTLWGPEDEQLIDWMYEESTKRYIHHYNFPPFSVWEVRMLRWVWRREIGHWRLAERALEAVLPSEAEFPYVIRVVSETMTCNGSSSMASVCWSTMSLMNAWVPIKAPVAWVAMWMIYDEETWDYKILTDIQAQEDFLWDMDFKVARTKDWITAMQLDVKIKWLKMEVFEKAFIQSKDATDHMLTEMLKVQPNVAPNLSPYAPLIMTLQIPVDKIRWVIGKWWENVQRMEKNYEVKISIADDGLTTITAKDQVRWQKVIEEIKEFIWEPEVWYKSKWKVVNIIAWVWAIVEFRGKSWMVHISKLSDRRVEKVEDILNIWDEIEFEIIQVDTVKWKIGLKNFTFKKEEPKKVDEKKEEVKKD